jgi:hypothetical protein
MLVTLNEGKRVNAAYAVLAARKLESTREA